MIVYPVEELARLIDHIIREEAAKPVMAARKLQEEMEGWLSEKLGIPVGHRQNNAKMKNEKGKLKYTDADWKKYFDMFKAGAISYAMWKLFQKEFHDERPGRKPFMPESYHGKGWGYGVSATKPHGEVIGMGGTASGYFRDPDTGKVVWTDLPLEYQFRKRHDLSTLVWKAVEDQEARVFDVIRGGRAMGRNVRDICGDLEQYINYPDGGERVLGRWRNMFPSTREGVREGYKREYLKEHGGLQPGSDAARVLLRQPDAQEWLKQKMAGVTFDEKTGLAKRGTPRLPDGVIQYTKRLGKAGLDYRAIRIARTETAAMIADEQEEIASNSDICTGEMDWVMDRGREHWNCNCQKYSEMSPWKVDDPERPEIPLHPNCQCEWRPRLKTDEEILAAFKEEMAEDLEIVRGSDEYEDMSDSADKTEAGSVLSEAVSLDMSGASDDKTPAIKVERGDIKYSSYEVAIQKEAEWLNKMMKDEGREFSSLVTYDGKVLGSWKSGGDPKKINYDTNELNDLLSGYKKGEVDLMHCHSRERLFANEDMNLLCRLEKAENVIVTFPNSGKKYALSVSDSGRRPTKDTIDRQWSMIYHSLELTEKQKLGVSKLSEEKKDVIINEVFFRMKFFYGWEMEEL